MGMGASLVLFAIGAVLTWALEVDTEGIDWNTVGVILMVVGAVGFIVSMLFWSPWAITRPRDETTGHDHGPTHTH